MNLIKNNLGYKKSVDKQKKRSSVNKNNNDKKENE